MLRALYSNIRYEFVDAVDGNLKGELSSSYQCNVKSSNKIDFAYRDKKISNVELACTVSHMRAIRKAYLSNKKYCLICEDDLLVNDVSSKEVLDLINILPADAAYLQLCITPPSTIQQLFNFYKNSGNHFASKQKNNPTKIKEKFLVNSPAHCAAIYLITRKGMDNIYNNYFSGDKVIFPCSHEEIYTNANILADRFIYSASLDESSNGYICCIPTFSYEALDSLLHPDHLKGHVVAKELIYEIRKNM